MIKKKTNDKKLVLTVETLRNLQPRELRQVVGGRAEQTKEPQGAPTDTTDCWLTSTF